MARRNGLALLGFLVAATLGLALVTPARATDTVYTWQGIGNAWDESANWDPNTGYPGTGGETGDTASFTAAGEAKNNVDLGASGNRAVDFIVLQGSGASYTIGSTAFSTLTINQKVTQDGTDSVISCKVATGAASDLQLDVLSGTLTLSGALSGAKGITKTGDGTVLLSGGNNTYAGLTAISAGTLKLGSASALGATAGATTVASGGTLDLNGFTLTMADTLTIAGTGVGGAGALVNTGGAATYGAAVTIGTGGATVGGTGNITLSSALVGTTVLTKVGSNTLILKTTSTRTGAVDINEGAIQLDASEALGKVTVNLNGGTLNINHTTLLGNASGRFVNINDGGTLRAMQSVSIQSKLTVGNAPDTSVTFKADLGATLILSQGAGGSRMTGGVIGGKLNIEGDGTVQIGDSGANRTVDVKGDWYIKPEATLRIRADTNLGTAADGNDVYFQGGTLRIANAGIIADASRIFDFSDPAGGTFYCDGQYLSLKTADNQLVGSAALTKIGTGRLVLERDNTGFSGPVSVEEGSLEIRTPDSLGSVGSKSPITLKSGVTLKLMNEGSCDFGNVVTLDGNANIDAENITAGTSGTETLGALNMSGQTLTVGGTVGYTLAVSGTTSLVGTNTFAVNTAGVDLALNGPVTGAAALTKSGAGTMILTNAANDYPGPTTVGAGALRANVGAGLSPNSNLILGGGVLEGSGAAAFDLALGGGAGEVQWTTAVASGFSANGGKLTVNIGGNATPDTLIWGTTLYFAAGNQSLLFGSATANDETEFRNPLDLGGDVRTVTVDAGTGGDFANLSGGLSNGSLTKAGAGTLVLSTANPGLTGTTTVSGGTLELQDAGALGSSAVVLTGTGALNLNAAGCQLVSVTAAPTSTVNLNVAGSLADDLSCSGQINYNVDNAGGNHTITIAGADLQTDVGVLTIAGGVTTLGDGVGGTDVLAVNSGNVLVVNSANPALLSLDRTTNLTLKPGAILSEPIPGGTIAAAIANLGTANDLFRGLAADMDDNITVATSGGGTPYQGLSTDSANSRRLSTGTITVDTAAGNTGAILQGIGARTLTIGNGTTAGGVTIMPNTDDTTATITTVGSVTLDDDAAVFGDSAAGKVVNFSVANGSTLLLNQNTAMGSGTGMAGITVASGGTLDLGAVTGAINGNVSLESGGALYLNDAGSLNGTGTITQVAGAITRLLTANALTDAAGTGMAAQSLGTVPGSIVRLDTSSANNINYLDASVSDAAIFVVAGGGTQNPTYGAGLTLDASGGVGGVLANDSSNRTLNCSAGITVGAGGATFAGTTGKTLTVTANVNAAGNPVTINSTTPIDGQDKAGSVVFNNPVTAGSLTAYPGTAKFMNSVSVSGDVTATDAGTNVVFDHTGGDVTVVGDIRIGGVGSVLYLDGGGACSNQNGSLSPKLADGTLAATIYIDDGARVEMGVRQDTPKVSGRLEINQPFVITGDVNPDSKRSFWVSRRQGTGAVPVTLMDVTIEEGGVFSVQENNTNVRAYLKLNGNATITQFSAINYDDITNVTSPHVPVTLTYGRIGDTAPVSTISGTIGTDVNIYIAAGEMLLSTGAVIAGGTITINGDTATLTGKVDSVSGAGDPPLATYDVAIRIEAGGGGLGVAQEATVATPSVGVTYFTDVTVADGAQLRGYKSGNQEFLVADLKLEGDASWASQGTGNAAIGNITGQGGTPANHTLTINTTTDQGNTLFGTLTNANIVYANAHANKKTLHLSAMTAGAGAYDSSFQLNGNKISVLGTDYIQANVDPGAGTLEALEDGRIYLMCNTAPDFPPWGDNLAVILGGTSRLVGRVEDNQTAEGGPRSGSNQFNGPVTINDQAWLVSSRTGTDNTLISCQYTFNNVQVADGALLTLDKDNAGMVVNFNQQGGAAGFARANADDGVCYGGIRGNGSITIQAPNTGNHTQNLVGIILTGTTMEIDDSTSTSAYRIRGPSDDWPGPPGFDLDGGTLQVTRTGTSYFAEVWPEQQIGNATNMGHIIVGKDGVTATGGLEVRYGDDGLNAAFGPNVDITLHYGGALRGFVQQGVDTAITQVINAPVTVKNDDADTTTVDGILASSKSGTVTDPPQGSIIGTVQFQNVTLLDGSRVRIETPSISGRAGNEAVLIGGPGGSLTVDSGKAALVNNSSDTLVTVENIDGVGTTLVLAGSNLTQIKGTVLGYGLQIGEGWTDPIGPPPSGPLYGKAIIQPTADLSGLGAGGVDVWANGDLRLNVAFNEMLTVREGGAAYVYQAFSPATLVLEKDSYLALLADGSFPAEPTIGAADIAIGKLNFTGTLVLNNGAGDPARIGVYGADASINDPIAAGAAGAATVKFLDGSTAAYAGSILSLGDGVDPDTKVMLADLAGTDATTTAVVIDRNMLILNKSTYTGGTTIDSSGTTGTSGASDNSVVVAHKNGLGTGNVTLQAWNSPALKTTLSLCAADFTLDALGNSKIIVNDRTELRINQDTDVGIELAGGTLAATGDVALGGTIALGAGDQVFDPGDNKLTLSNAVSLGSGGEARVWDVRTGDEKKGRVVFSGPVSGGSGAERLTVIGPGTLDLSGGLSNLSVLNVGDGSSGGVVVTNSPLATADSVTVWGAHAYSVTLANHGYGEVDMASSKGVIALSANAAGVTYDFDNVDFDSPVSTFALGALPDLDTGAMTARTFQGTLKPDLGKILKEGAATGGEAYAFVYSLGGGGGLLVADIVLGNQPKPLGWPDQDPYLFEEPYPPDPETMLRIGYGQGPLAAGVVRVDQTNTLTGEVQVYGNLVLGKTDALDSVATIRVFASGTFDLGGNALGDVATAIGKLNMKPSDGTGVAVQGGGIANDGASELGAGLLDAATLSALFPTGEATEWDFVIGSGNPGGWTKIEDGALTGAKAFRKVGADTVVLPDASGASLNSYSGAAGTIVEAGTLVVKDTSSLGGAASTLPLTVQDRGTVKFDVA
ncbi:MAG: autotransporter-associated beta strand repeat-containing protein, partial [Planctomycetes bacterium]|nr:autotransporter-associated beta strand repeat-containing protein [Planctomycetota bacterium]